MRTDVRATKAKAELLRDALADLQAARNDVTLAEDKAWRAWTDLTESLVGNRTARGAVQAVIDAGMFLRDAEPFRDVDIFDLLKAAQDALTAPRGQKGSWTWVPPDTREE